ncbi:MAG TPA: hypothetical protein VH301_15730 [Usitatibacter sp.]|jgi:hypothetical protein|nr:hypothetical protein [Usitatibacter sp.]
MNTRTRTLLAAAAWLAVASATGARAADQSAFFDQQRQISDGYYPTYTVSATPQREKPETRHQALEDRWLVRERAMGSGVVAPVPFPVPAVASAKSTPATLAQGAAVGPEGGR